MRLQDSPAVARQVRRWARQHAALAEACSLEDLLRLVDHGPASVKDEIVRALLVLFQGGQFMAGRVVLQLLLPKLTKLSHTTSRPAHITDAAENFQRILAAFWQVLTDFPTARPKVVAGLVLGTLNTISGARDRQSDLAGSDPRVQEFAVEDLGYSDRGQLAGRLQAERMCLEHLDPGEVVTLDAPPTDGDIYEVLAWGLDVGALSRAEAAMLADIYGPGRVRPETERYGHEHGLSREVVSQRCRRARQRLSAAVQRAAAG